MHLTDYLRRPIGSGGFVAEIDGLRFFAILPVVLDHAWWTFRVNVGDPGFGLDSPLGRIFSAGGGGVQLFFMISGYVLGLGFYRSAKALRGVGLGHYFFRRLRRLEPPFILIMTTFYLLLLASDRFDFVEGLGHYLASISYSHGLIYLKPSPINTVTWSLEVELQFYILAPLLYAAYQLPARTALALLALLAVAFIASANAIGDFYLTLLSHGHFFLLGAIFPIFRTFRLPNAAAIAFPAALVAYFLIKADYASVPGNVTRMVLLTVVFGTALGCESIRRFLSTPALYIVGGACYSIYLIHYPLLSAFSKVWSLLALPGGFSAFLAAALVIVLFVSMAFYVIAERPFMSRRDKQDTA